MDETIKSGRFLEKLPNVMMSFKRLGTIRSLFLSIFSKLDLRMPSDKASLIPEILNSKCWVIIWPAIMERRAEPITIPHIDHNSERSSFSVLAMIWFIERIAPIESKAAKTLANAEMKTCLRDDLSRKYITLIIE